ncbi:MAG: DsbA family oxidoreductase [Rhodothermales bacterium]
MTVEIYSDVACPWCYVGERRFARALAAFPHTEDVEVVFRSYQLDPTLPETPRPLTESLRKKFGPRLDATLRQTAATAREDGLDLRFDDALAVNTLTAHRLLRFALERGGPDVQRALADKLFEAHFTRGLNVADHTVLADLAEAVGLDRDDALVYLGVGDGEDEVRAEIAEAQRLGIRAVPTFVFDGRFAVQGAQPASAFLQVLEEAWAERREGPVPSAEATGADGCADGACAT